MPIHFVTGDLLESNVSLLVNPVNCHGVMGKGLALQFKKKYPKYFNHYRQLCQDGQLRPGRVYIYLEDNQPAIVNFPTKNHWKDDSLYDYIEKGLMSLSDAITSLDVRSIAIPKLGCGEGNLDWSIVQRMIVNRLSHHHNCNIYVYGPMC